MSSSAGGGGGSKERDNSEHTTPHKRGRDTTPLSLPTGDEKKGGEYRSKREDSSSNSNSSNTPSVFTFHEDHIHKDSGLFAAGGHTVSRDSPLKQGESATEHKQGGGVKAGGGSGLPHPTFGGNWADGRDKGLRVNLAAAHLNNMSTPVTSEGQWGTPSAPPHSPGALSWHGEAPTSSDKSSEGLEQRGSRISRKESYKAQRQHYRREKQKATSALLSSLGDPSTLILADWLKVRGSLKSWTKLWCVLKPGLLLLYKSPKTKSNHWVGTVLLSTCHVMERPSKKEGFCFKLYHPLEQGIWAPRGPHNEAMGAVVQPLPSSHLIFRAPSKASGHCWLDGLELAQRCSNTLLRNSRVLDSTANHETQWSPEDMEKHFTQQELSESDSDAGGGGPQGEELVENAPSAGEEHGDGEEDQADGVLAILKNVYVDEINDEIVQKGEVVEELAEENKSLLWYLIKQVRPGMDLSRVALPTFVLEPRSFLDKLADSFYHSDILARAVKETDPYTRMKTVVTWYLSGLYKKPKGLKKPYNPVLGEQFRCCWLHGNGTRTYYIAEQVSHHPPVSAFYVSNRKEGYTVQATILARSKFYGNSTSAILDGRAAVRLLELGEVYLCTSPYAHCGGLLLGTLSMELGGRVSIRCPTTDFTADIEFKLKPFIGGSDSINMVSGRIRHNKETLATLEGHWDGKIDIKDKRTQEEGVLLDVSELKHKRLKRQLVAGARLGELESQRLWSKVSEAIDKEDQVAATEEKIKIEEAQRTRAREAGGRVWIPKHFIREPLYNEGEHQYNFVYNHHNAMPWDDSVEVLEYEEDFVIKSLRRQPTTHPIQVEQSASETDSVGSRGASAVMVRTRGTEGVIGGIPEPTLTATLLRVEHALGDQKNTLREVVNAVHRLEQRERGMGGHTQATRLYTQSTLGALLLGCVLHWIYSWWGSQHNT